MSNLPYKTNNMKTELEEILRKQKETVWSSNGGHSSVTYYSFSSIISAMQEAIKEVWELACKQTLNDISKTFKENSHKGQTNGDRDVFEAISDTIVNFPIPEMPFTLSLPESKQVWHKQSHRPEYSKDKDILHCSVSVLLYSPELDIYSIGWFDFENDKWSHIADEEMDDFVWTELTKYKKP